MTNLELADVLGERLVFAADELGALAQFALGHLKQREESLGDILKIHTHLTIITQE